MSNSTSAPLSPRTGLAIAAAITGLTLAGGATLATTLGWMHPTTAAASTDSANAPTGTVAAPAPVVASPAGPVRADPSQAAPLTHVDEVGNVWAWYGSGDWVLIAPAPPAPAPVLASGREGRGERDEHAYQRGGERPARATDQRSFFAGREVHDDD